MKCLIIPSEKTSSASLFLQKKIKCLNISSYEKHLFSEEIMRHLIFLFGQIMRHYIFSEEQIRHSIFYCCNNVGRIILLVISSKKMRSLLLLVISFEKIKCLTMSLKKGWFFFEEIMKHFIFFLRNNDALWLVSSLSLIYCFSSEKIYEHHYLFRRHVFFKEVMRHFIFLEKKSECLIFFWRNHDALNFHLKT